MIKTRLLTYLTLTITTLCGQVVAQPNAFALSSAHPQATEAGRDILLAGGNAFDAAVAMSAVLAVVEPYSSGIGGGGFWLLHRQKDNHQVMIDGREKAPLAAHRDLYVDDKGEIIERLSIDGALAAGIPGEPAALAHISENYGKRSLKQNLQAAINLAQQGFAVTPLYQKFAGWRKDALNASEAASAIFLHEGDIPDIGAIIRQPDLAATLSALAAQGRDGFYRGEVAQQLVTSVQDAGGIWTLEDLDSYTVVEREPVTFTYQDMRITSAALPSSGGIVLAEIFNMMSHTDFKQQSGVQQLHLLIELMRRAYRDRAEYLGDSDFVSVPGDLLGSNYAKQLISNLNTSRATPSDQLRPVSSKKSEGNDTTHFSVVDGEGNRVAATLSINYLFGSGFVAAGTGVLLNDEMDDFSAKPGVPNVYGLVGAEANAIEPGKRMLSSMSPTFLETPERIAILGTPGGSRIITMVLLAAIAFENNFTAQQMVDLPRMHHQYLPDSVEFEPASVADDYLTALKAMGHEIKTSERDWGNMHVVIQNKASGTLEAAADKRGEGTAHVNQ